MKKMLLYSLGILLSTSVVYAQEIDTLAEESNLEMVEGEETTQAVASVDLGSFNYGYFRLSFLRPLGQFNNPMVGSEFSDAKNFFFQASIPNGVLTLGIEIGRTRHIKRLNLVTPMLKLGINSGFGIHAFGPKTVVGSNYEAQTNGTYILRVGLGPQLTFKPTTDIRIGLYYRANLALAYSSYGQYSYYGPSDEYYDELMLQAVNIGYNGDLGIEASWNMLSVGISYSHMRSRLKKGQIVDLGDLAEGVNIYTRHDESGDEMVYDVNPILRYNRFALSVGIVF